MKKIGIILGIVLFVVIIALAFMSKYNTMINYEEEIKTQWANVESKYQRRIDLIPNLVETVKGYANFEKSTLTEIAALRSQAGQAKVNWDKAGADPGQRAQAANQMESTLSRLLVIVERYPDLKANQNFLALQSQLEGTENRISVERDKYNEKVKTYNAYIRRFPNHFIANMYGFQQKTYFEAQKGAENAPKVTF